MKEEQINEIINDNENMLNKDKDKNKNKEYILVNENNVINDILLDICNKENNIKLRIEELKEFLLMLNEEKNCTNKELINLISYKETLDTIIKMNIHNIHNKIKKSTKLIIKMKKIIKIIYKQIINGQNQLNYIYMNYSFLIQPH